MGENRSPAVRAQRHEPPDSLDDFPTPPWAGRALLQHLDPAGDRFDRLTAWEPAANRGALVAPLGERFGQVLASDVMDYGPGWPVHDFLFPYLPFPRGTAVDWIVTNPPFVLADEFAARALDVAREGVALFVRLGWLEGLGGREALFQRQPPTELLFFCERVVIWKGRILDPDVAITREDKSGRTVTGKPSTASGYVWAIWDHGRGPQPPAWVPPRSRWALTRPGDYDVDGGVLASARIFSERPGSSLAPGQAAGRSPAAGGAGAVGPRAPLPSIPIAGGVLPASGEAGAARDASARGEAVGPDRLPLFDAPRR